MYKDPDFLVKKLNKIRGLKSDKIDLGLSRVEELLKELDSPHKKIPPVIHVAGTNGKGTVAPGMWGYKEPPKKKRRKG